MMAGSKRHVVNVDSPLKQFIVGLYGIRQELDKREVYKGATLENYTAQSVSNRSVGCHLVTVNATFPDVKPVVVKLAKGWQPARDKVGYNAESVGIIKAEVIWQKYQACDIKPDNLAKECAALIGYFVDNLITGAIVSGENALKAMMLKHALDTLKPVSLKVTLKQDAVTLRKDITGDRKWYETPFSNEIVYELSDIQALVNAAWPRVQLALNVPIAKDVATARTPRASALDI